MDLYTTPKKSKPPYLLGLICLIPFFGAFVGGALLIFGIFKYKDKWLSLIGIGGILYSIIILTVFIYAIMHGSVYNKGLSDLSQMQLNNAVKNIEYYKLSHGQYPDSLSQLSIDDKFAPIIDPLQNKKKKGLSYYNYEKINDRYLVYSSGIDGIAKTKDDLFPNIAMNDSSKIGLIKHW